MVFRVRKFSRFELLVILTITPFDCFGQECWLNDPFAPFVKVELRLEPGELVLKLRNDFQKPVRLTQITLLVEGTESPILLLQQPVDLPPADRHYSEIGGPLKNCFDEAVERQEKVIRFRLSLEPEPPGQPKECSYRVALENQRFAKCVRISSEP
jgi:hypothetical protein